MGQYRVQGLLWGLAVVGQTLRRLKFCGRDRWREEETVDSVMTEGLKTKFAQSITLGSLERLKCFILHPMLMIHKLQKPLPFSGLLPDYAPQYVLKARDK